MEWMDVSEVHPYESNPRINDGAVDAVAASIAEFGFKSPIIVDRNGVIIAGHTRLKAALSLKMDKVPVIVADDLTEEQARAYRLADNKTAELAEWDSDLLDIELGNIEDIDMSQFGFDLSSMDEPLFDSDDVEEDEFEPIIPEVPVSKRGDIYRLGDHILMCGDSTSEEDVAKLMQGDKADMVFTDPPYGMNLDCSYGGMSNNPRAASRVVKGYSDVIGDRGDFNPNLIRTIFDNFGYADEIFLWGADYYSDMIPDRKDGSWMVWDKRATIVVEWSTSEFELCWSKKRHHRRILRHTWHGMIGLSSEDINRVHPTQKPVRMIAECIGEYSEKNQIIVDLYGGSGSTLIACEQTGRKCRMMELDPHYCDVIVQRWEEYTGLKAEQIGGS